VRYVPTIISQSEIRQAIAEAGFKLAEEPAQGEDAEAVARKKRSNTNGACSSLR